MIEFMEKHDIIKVSVITKDGGKRVANYQDKKG